MNVDQDAIFFQQHPDRMARIRKPGVEIVVDPKTRQAHTVAECRNEFLSLGPHDHRRRRLILWRVPPDNPLYDSTKPQILKIPFLAFADEEIADRDDILLPIVQQIMQDALAREAMS